MRDIWFRALLAKARDAFERCGFVPYLYGAQLERAGFIVSKLEENWGRS